MPVSIIIPSYNRASIIGKTMDSILSQSSKEWECIVVDDHSNDDTKSVIAGFVNKDARVSYYINEKKKGAQGARNTGLAHAKYEWVVFFDSDNIMHPDFVELMLGQLRDDMDVLACCANIVNVNTGITDGVMNPRCYGNIHKMLFTGHSYVDFNQAIIRKRRIIEIGGLDEDCPSMQEWDTHIRLSKIARYSMIEKSLVDYFQGGSDTISSNLEREINGRLFILKKHNTEWRLYWVGLTRFCYQIYYLIQKSSTEVLKVEKIKELRSLVPFFCFSISAAWFWKVFRLKK